MTTITSFPGLAASPVMSRMSRCLFEVSESLLGSCHCFNRLRIHHQVPELYEVGRVFYIEYSCPESIYIEST